MDSLCVSSLRRSRKPKLSLNQPGCLYDTDTCYNGQKGEVFGNGGGSGVILFSERASPYPTKGVKTLSEGYSGFTWVECTNDKPDVP